MHAWWALDNSPLTSLYPDYRSIIESTVQLAAKLKAAMDSNQDAQAAQILAELKVHY